MKNSSPLLSVRMGVVAGVLGAGSALVAVSVLVGDPLGIELVESSSDVPGDVSGPCDEPEHVGDPRCAGVDGTVSTESSTSSTSTTQTSTTPSIAPPPTTGPPAEVRSFDAAGAGTVTYAVEGSSFRLLSATPSPGWAVVVEQSSGIELDLDFRTGTRRVQVDVEFEDGGVRERVRLRDDADDSRIETTNGIVTDVRPGDGDDDDRDDRDEDGDRDDDRDDDDRDDDDRDDDDEREDEDRSGSNSGRG